MFIPCPGETTDDSGTHTEQSQTASRRKHYYILILKFLFILDYLHLGGFQYVNPTNCFRGNFISESDF